MCIFIFYGIIRVTKTVAEKDMINSVKDFYDEKSCTLCPRGCSADRSTARGRCGAGSKIKIAAAMPHMWEEPCISGEKGSGTVFFSGCQLGCVFCQNKSISLGNFGQEIDAKRFEQICFELKDKGAHNISLVSADQYVPYVLPVLKKIKKELALPIVYNCSGYQSPRLISALEGVVDIYLPDLKFFSSEISYRYAKASDYFDIALSAIKQMAEQTGKPVIENSLMKRGTMVRHLILPGHRRDSIDIIRHLGESFKRDEIMVSLMAQYTPTDAQGAPKRRITSFEYQSVCDELEKYGFEGYYQQLSSAKQEYTPDFALQGVIKS